MTAIAAAKRSSRRRWLPEGVDAARLLAMAEGEFLTRDLINTPASDMGPDELEAAFLALAERFGATAEVTGARLLEDGFPDDPRRRQGVGPRAAPAGHALGEGGAEADAGRQGRVL